MAATSLQEALRTQATSQAPREGDYRGASTAASFAGAHEEFSALLTGCGVYDLGFRARTPFAAGMAEFARAPLREPATLTAAGRG